MKPASFKYIAPRTLDEALAAKAEHGDEAMFLAGGQSLVPAMNFRLAAPAVLIDINTISDLQTAHLDSGSGALRLSAQTRHRDLQFDPVIGNACPLLRNAIVHVAHPQIRNRGTLCGNLSHADPASEMPAVMLALDARMHLASQSIDRRVAALDFFQGIYTTACKDEEMLVGVEIAPPPPNTSTCFLEVARRPGDYAMMGVAASITLDSGNRCTAARLAYCSAGETPVLATAAADTLVGSDLSDDAVNAAAEDARRTIDPLGSVHATPDYQRHLAAVLTRRALRALRADHGVMGDAA